MTWHEWARQIWPGLSDDEAGVILWNCTCFPLGPIELIESQFRESHAKSGGDVSLALQISSDELDAAMQAHGEQDGGGV